MSKHTELVHKIAEEQKVSMEHLLTLEDKVWEHLRNSNPNAYNEMLSELEDMRYTIDLDEAKNIVRAMKPFGEYWSYEQIQDYLKSKNVHEDCLEYYLAMNMARNDYTDTARKYALENDPDFYYGIATDFIYDEDAEPHKVGKYFKC